MRGRFVGIIACGVLAVALWCDTATALPDHPIITEVYTDPPGATDGPVGRPPSNEHQSFIEIYIPTASALDPALNGDALRLTFYEVEGDSTSSGTGLVNYRFDLPTFDLIPGNGITDGAIERPSSGIVVLGWVDYVGNPPSGLAGSPSTRLGLVNGEITTPPSDYTFIAINGNHFSGTTNFPVLLAENLIDLPNEALTGVIQNGSSAYLLVDRDAPGYVELCDDKHALDCPAGADPVLPDDNFGLSTTALLDGFAGNDDDLFDVLLQPYNFDPTFDLATVLPRNGAFSLLIAQVPEKVKDRPAPGIANGYARIYVDVAKTTETGATDNPAVDAVEAYRHVRNVGPFFPSPGVAPFSTSAPELGVALGVEQSFEILTQTTGRPGLLCANVGGNTNINIAASGGTSSNPSVATFTSGSGVSGIAGQAYGFPGITISLGGSAAPGATASATVTVTASNTAGGPSVVAPVQITTVTATVVNPTQGLNATGQPFQTTVFIAVQAVPASGATNELLNTDLGDFLVANLGGLARDTLGNGTLLTSGSTNLNDGLTVDAMLEDYPALVSEYINPQPLGAPLDLKDTVLQSAEQAVFGTYNESFNSGNTALRAIRLNIRDTLTFGGTFSPSEIVHFVDARGFVAGPRTALSNANTTRTFEMVIVDTNVRPDSSIETGATDDFGIVVEVDKVETGASVLPGELVFLSFTGGLQGADIDTLDVPPSNNVVNLIFFDLDNLHSVLGIRSIEAIYVIDTNLINGELDVIEVFSLNPVNVVECTTNPECDNSVFCDGVETCVANSCQPGSPVNCNDGVACTTDSCNETTDSCDNTPNDASCNNGLFCDGTETCDPDFDCQSGLSIDCDDGVPCTIDSCNENADTCENVPDDASCDDGLFCNGLEVCDPQTDCQSGDPPCPPEFCDEGAGECVGCQNNGECDDGNECTTDLCTDLQCSNPPLVDDTPCAGGQGTCQSGECITSGCTTNAECDDSDPCTFDLCVDNACVNTAAEYADVAGPGGSCGPDGNVSLVDILAVLNGFRSSFASPCDRSNIDIAGNAGVCPPNGVIDLADILVVLDAFRGEQACCPAP